MQELSGTTDRDTFRRQDFAKELSHYRHRLAGHKREQLRRVHALTTDLPMHRRNSKFWRVPLSIVLGDAYNAV